MLPPPRLNMRRSSVSASSHVPAKGLAVAYDLLSCPWCEHWGCGSRWTFPQSPQNTIIGWFSVLPDRLLWTKPERTRNTETVWSAYSILIFAVAVVTIIRRTYFLSMLCAFSHWKPLDWTRITHIMFLVLSFSPPPLPTPRLSLISAHPHGRLVSHAIRIHMLPC